MPLYVNTLNLGIKQDLLAALNRARGLNNPDGLVVDEGLAVLRKAGLLGPGASDRLKRITGDPMAQGREGLTRSLRLFQPTAPRWSNEELIRQLVASPDLFHPESMAERVLVYLLENLSPAEGQEIQKLPGRPENRALILFDNTRAWIFAPNLSEATTARRAARQTNRQPPVTQVEILYYGSVENTIHHPLKAPAANRSDRMVYNVLRPFFAITISLTLFEEERGGFSSDKIRELLGALSGSPLPDMNRAELRQMMENEIDALERISTDPPLFFKNADNPAKLRALARFIQANGPTKARAEAINALVILDRLEKFPPNQLLDMIYRDIPLPLPEAAEAKGSSLDIGQVVSPGPASKDLTPATVLFGSPLPLDRKNRFVSLLKNRHRENVITALVAEFFAALPPEIEDREFKAKVRAIGAINEAIDFVADYLAALEAAPHLSVEEKRGVLTEIFQRMRRQAPSYAMDDVNRAFEAFLREMRLVDVENLFIREVKPGVSSLDPPSSAAGGLRRPPAGRAGAGMGQVSQNPTPALLDSTERTDDERTDVGERRILPFGRKPGKPRGSGTGGNPLKGALLLAGGLAFANEARGDVEERPFDLPQSMVEGLAPLDIARGRQGRPETRDLRPETEDQGSGVRGQGPGIDADEFGEGEGGIEAVDENVETVEVPVDEGAESPLSLTTSGLMPWTTPLAGASSAFLSTPAAVLLRR